LLGIGHSNERGCLGCLCGKTEGNLENLGQCRRSHGRDLNPRPPEFEAGRRPLDGDFGWQGMKYKVHANKKDRDSSVGIAARYGLDGRIPMGSRFSSPIPDRSWSPPSNLYNGYLVFPGSTAAGAWH
jgi:hypothetical protein